MHGNITDWKYYEKKKHKLANVQCPIEKPWITVNKIHFIYEK